MEVMTDQAPRPGQATLAGWLIIVGSAVLVVAAWQRIAGLHTLEVQDQLRKILSEPPVAGSGVTLSALSDTIRVLAMVAAGAATASTILGFQALRRSTSARVALTCLAPLIAVGGLATAGFLAPMVVAGVVMLWLRPTRDWFRGSNAEASTERPDPLAAAPTAAPPPPPPPPAAPWERPEMPGRAPAMYAAPPAHARAPRPAALIAACVVTWVSSALVGGMMALTALLFLVAPDAFFDEAERQRIDLRGMSHDQITTAVLIFAGVSVVWCVVAAVLAGLAIAGRRWAWIALATCTAGAGLVALVAALSAPFVVLLVAAAAVTCALLVRPDVKAWFRR